MKTKAFLPALLLLALASGGWSSPNGRVASGNAAGQSASPQTNPPPPPRYAVIDLGPDWIPVGLNNHGAVVGNSTNDPDYPKAAVWKAGTWYPLQIASTETLPGAWVSGITDTGLMVGSNVWYGQNPDGSFVIYPEQAVSWADENAAPSPLGIYGEGGSAAMGISNTGRVVGFAGRDVIYYPVEFSGGAAVPLPSPVPADLYVLFQRDIAQRAAGSHWIGSYLLQGRQGPEGETFYSDSGALFDGQKYSGAELNAVNASGIAVGLGADGNPLVLGADISLGQGFPIALNDRQSTDENGNSVPLPQIVGVGGAGGVFLWDKTQEDGTPAATYVRKDLNRLIPADSGYRLIPSSSSIGIEVSYNLAALAINDAGVIMGTATYSGADSSVGAGTHGVLLLPMELNSKDRMLVGSVKLPDGWTGVGLHFVNATTGQDLGTYADIVGNMTAAQPAFKIYASQDDIYSDDELAADHNGTLDASVRDQKVVFYRDASDPQKLHFATTFDDLGDVRVELVKDGAVMGYGGLRLTADQDTADLIAEVDARIGSINPPPVIDPIDITVTSGGGGDDGLGLLVAQEPGTLANPGAVDAAKTDPAALPLPVHAGTGLPTAADNDLSLVTLRRPVGAASGTIALSVSAPSSVVLFDGTASHVLADSSVDLANPSGDLAALATGNAQIWVRGAAANADVTLTYTFTDANGVVQASDIVHLSVLAAGAAAPIPAAMRLGGASLKVNLTRMQAGTAALTQPLVASGAPLQNRGLTTKSLLDFFRASAEGTWKLPTAYVKGVIDGGWDGFKGDVGGAVAFADLATHLSTRGAEIYHGLKALADLNASQLAQIGQNMVDSFVTGSEQSLPWTYQGGAVDAASLNFYIQGYVTGYVGEQIGTCLVAVGVVTKAGKVLKTVVQASSAGRMVLAGVNAAMQFRTKAFHALVQFVNDANAVRQAQRMVKRIGDLQIGGQSAGKIIQDYLASVPGATANWNTIAKEIAGYAGKDMDGVGYAAYKRLAQVISILGPQATEKAVVSFAKEYRLMLTGSQDVFDSWIALFDTSSAGGRAEMNAFLENSKSFLDDPDCYLVDGGRPSNNGFAGTSAATPVPQGTILDRYGDATGDYLAPAGTPSWARSLPPSGASRTITRYRVKTTSFAPQGGRAAPWYAQPGGGIQYDCGQSIQNLIDAGVLEAVP